MTTFLTKDEQKLLDRVLYGGGFGLVFGPVRKKALNKFLESHKLTASSMPFTTEPYTALTILEYARYKQYKSVSFLEKRLTQEQHVGLAVNRSTTESESSTGSSSSTSSSVSSTRTAHGEDVKESDDSDTEFLSSPRVSSPRVVQLSPENLTRLKKALYGGGLGLIFGPVRRK